MSRWVRRPSRSGWLVPVLVSGAAALSLAGCSSAPEIAPADQPLTKQTIMLLGKKGMTAEAPIFVRIFKEESELEIWKARDDGRYYHFKTYPICNWSGELGPKQKQGDRQAPEGFYTVAPNQLNPNSQFHVSFNIGYPNAYDRSHGRDGQFLMVHGKCKSAGCYAMTDALMEEIYGLAREAIKGGQQRFEVHAFPFRMTADNMERHKASKWMPFWKTLQQGYEHFEAHRLPPTVAICERRYNVNVAYAANVRFDAEDRCPRFMRPQIEPFVPKPAEQQIAAERISVPGPKMRTAENILPGGVEPLAGATDADGGNAIASTSFGRMLGLGAAPSRSNGGTGFGFASQ
ncbi:MAG: murein L,D-transpeptidase [Hyphomicrobiaceae bacterium]|nr:murein L,D-transpeptidase [Hyphomicrobiaceae bacterium]